MVVQPPSPMLDSLEPHLPPETQFALMSSRKWMISDTVRCFIPSSVHINDGQWLTLEISGQKEWPTNQAPSRRDFWETNMQPPKYQNLLQMIFRISFSKYFGESLGGEPFFSVPGIPGEGQLVLLQGSPNMDKPLDKAMWWPQHDAVKPGVFFRWRMPKESLREDVVNSQGVCC